MIIEDGVLKKVEDEDIPSSGVFRIPEGITEIHQDAFVRM